MTKQNTTTKQSSGKGFQFENEVVAFVLAHLLARSSPFDPPGGVVERVEVQKPATEWHLEDLLVTAIAYGQRYRLAFSMKSNEQISKNRFPPDFVHTAWRQLLRDSSPAFEEDLDYLGLITVPAAPQLKKAIFYLLQFARNQDPTSLATEIALPRRTNDTVRNLLRSAKCPSDLAAKHAIEEGNAVRFLRRMAWVPLDFEDENSSSRREAVQLCQRLLRSGSSDEGRNLWARLEKIAAKLRHFGGDIDLSRLASELRGQFKFLEFPDYRTDWSLVTEDSVWALNRIPSTIGGTVILPRRPEHDAVNQTFATHRTVILLGASGSGKSAIGKVQAERAMVDDRALWLDAGRLRARNFTEWRPHLGLAHSFGEIVRTTPVAKALLVLDGLDRLYDDADFATTAEFIRAVRLEDETSPWRVLMTCTPEEWERVYNKLSLHSCLPTALKTVEIGSPAAAELKAVWVSFPKLRPLRARRHLEPVLLRPKVLDLLAIRAKTSDDLSIVGESHLARWFWERWIADGPNAISQAEAALRFAEHLADKLVPDVSVSTVPAAVGAANVPGIKELTESRVLRQTEGRVAFDHDLYADWVRVRQLIEMEEAGQLADFLATRLSSPVWHRALRTFGVHLLEQSDNLARWTSVFQAAGAIPAPAGILVQDILLESTVFASTSGTGFFRDELWPLLAKGSGRLLERLLKRLFHTATIPNPTMAEFIARQNPKLAIYAAAWARLPYPPYWFSILALLHAHRKEIPSHARGLTAGVADLWLRSTSHLWPFRKEAAALAVALAENMLKHKEEDDRLFDNDDADQQVYCAVLASGQEEPEAVTQIVLEAAGRRNQRFKPPPATEEELAELRERNRKYAVWGFSGPSRPLPEPWPHGPAFRVDGALQKTVFDSDALQPLAKALPHVAREALLALLISGPDRNPSDDDFLYKRFSLEGPSWYPPFYTRGPFRAFLAIAEEEAVTTILQLVEHVTYRWAESYRLYVAQERGCSPSDIKVPSIPILSDDKEHDYIGDARVFTWAQQADYHGVIGTALTALEKRLYDLVDAGDDVTPLVQRLLTESRSLAIIGLLSVFGRRHPQYLRGPLRGLLVSPYVLDWTVTGSVANEIIGIWKMDLLLVPAPLRGEYCDWHEMPHRKMNLLDFLLVFLHDPALRPLFQETKERLEICLQPGGSFEGWAVVERLVALFDPRNYTEIKHDLGKTSLQYTPPAKLLENRTEAEFAQETELSLMTIQLQCRQLLDKADPVPTETINGLWASVQWIVNLELNSADCISRAMNSLVGVAAVLIQRGGKWLTEHPEQAEWARRTLLDAALEDRRADDSYKFGAQLDRLLFAAEALPALWADQPNSSEFREAIARLALHSPSEIVGTLTSGVAAVRERLREDHLRLLHVVLLRAGLEPRIWRAGRRDHWGTDEDNSENEERSKRLKSLWSEIWTIERSFVSGTLTAVVPGLDEISPLGPLGERKARRLPHRRKAARRLVEESLLVAAYRGVPNPGEHDDLWFPVWKRIVIDTVGPLAPADRGQTEDLDDPPGAWGSYLMERVAGVVAAIGNPVAARQLWQPLIDLGASAPQWVSEFARCWNVYPLSRDVQGPIIESWTEMIDTALANSRWKAGPHGTGEMWQALLGFSNRGPDIWTDELRPRVRLLRPRLARWTESHFADPDNVRAFARFLTHPAAADLIFDGLIWLDRESQLLGDRFWGRPSRRELPDEAVFSLLAHVWGTAQEALRRNDSAFRAFRDLLQILVTRQYPPALELTDRVGAIAS